MEEVMVKKIRWRMKRGTRRVPRRKHEPRWEKVGEDVPEAGKLAGYILFGKGDVALVPDNETLEAARWDRLDPLPTAAELEGREPKPKIPMKLVNHGGGWYSVKNGETGELVNEAKLRIGDALALTGVEYDEVDKSADA